VRSLALHFQVICWCDEDSSQRHQGAQKGRLREKIDGKSIKVSFKLEATEMPTVEV